MVDSKDGKYIFLGQPDGVAVIDASNQQTVTVWEDQSAAITSIHVTLLSDETYLLSTVDENGTLIQFILIVVIKFFKSVFRILFV